MIKKKQKTKKKRPDTVACIRDVACETTTSHVANVLLSFAVEYNYRRTSRRHSLARSAGEKWARDATEFCRATDEEPIYYPNTNNNNDGRRRRTYLTVSTPRSSFFLFSAGEVHFRNGHKTHRPLTNRRQMSLKSSLHRRRSRCPTVIVNGALLWTSCCSSQLLLRKNVSSTWLVCRASNAKCGRVV